jgi:S1-C subfamily serine protease
MLPTNSVLKEGVSAVVDLVMPSIGYLLAKDGAGSCWAFDKNTLVTNAHVVSGNEEPACKVRIDGHLLDAVVLGSDPRTDIAVVKVKSALRPLQVQAASRVGDFCLAIGSPYGFLNSVSFGLVSGLNRSTESAHGILENLLQTDAALNEGNSGGPLINMSGEVIGMSTMSRRQAEAMHYAVSAEVISFIVPLLMKKKKVEYGQMGILLAEQMDSTGTTRVSVVRAFESDTALRVRDQIVAIERREVRRRVDVLYAMAECAGAKSFQVTVVREGKMKKVKVASVKEEEE